MNRWQAQFDRCTGPAPRPLVKPRPETGIDRELRELREQKLAAIENEYQQEFGGEK
jgi:hypothetical protein